MISPSYLRREAKQSQIGRKSNVGNAFFGTAHHLRDGKTYPWLMGKDPNTGKILKEREGGMYKKILVPLDGSKTAEGVLPHAKALAYSEGAEIILLNVASNPAQSFAFEDPAIAGVTVEDEEEKAGKYMDTVCRKLRTAGFKVTCMVRQGGAASMILKVAEDLGVDVIAMSTHGRSGAAHWLIGSVAERVVRHSKIPVMMIRVSES